MAASREARGRVCTRCLSRYSGRVHSLVRKNPAGVNLTGLEVLWRSEVGVSPFTGRFAHGRAQWARRGPPSNSAHPRGSRLRARARNIARRFLRGQALLCGARLDPARLGNIFRYNCSPARVSFDWKPPKFDTPYAYKLSEVVLRVSECVEAVSEWCRSVSIDTSLGGVDCVQKCPSVN